MYSYQQKVSSHVTAGFTLIELMIVVAIMSTALALIGPTLFKSYEKAQYRTDIVELKDTLRKISYKAFINGRKVTLELKGKDMTFMYMDSSSKPIKHSFEHISFEHQNIVFSEFGFAKPSQLRVKTSAEAVQISLTELIPI